jgi:SAM-dependent methyltransferase
LTELHKFNKEVIEQFIPVLTCPVCHGHFRDDNGKLACNDCGLVFGRNDDGFIEFVTNKQMYETESTTQGKAEAQSSAGAKRVDDEYIKPFIHQEHFERVLDVGCGVGRTISSLLEEGYEAYGIDLPCLSQFWSQAGNSVDNFMCCDALNLPFQDDYFDVVISLGVIEHIGTVSGHTTLRPDYRKLRQKYADELTRVTRPGGRILLAGPNKRFPIDPQHQVRDDASPKGLSIAIRDKIFQKTGLNIHPVWGDYHLMSYSDVDELFCRSRKASRYEALPLKNYFGFNMFKSGYFRFFDRFAQLWLNGLPRSLRTSFINPYVIVQIRK